jgi:hypothetical protein
MMTVFTEALKVSGVSDAETATVVSTLLDYFHRVDVEVNGLEFQLKGLQVQCDLKRAELTNAKLLADKVGIPWPDLLPPPPPAPTLSPAPPVEEPLVADKGKT